MKSKIEKKINKKKNQNKLINVQIKIPGNKIKLNKTKVQKKIKSNWKGHKFYFCLKKNVVLSKQKKNKNYFKLWQQSRQGIA